ncbi:MAG: GEVED domain-containing protein, partial [Catalinimonas sp.]
MKQSYRTWRGLCLPLLLLMFAARADDCPAPACVPGSAPNNGFGYGIFRVVFNTIDTTTNGVADGYQDYSCTDSTLVAAGQAYNLRVETGTGFDENVRAWIDWNGDGQFAANELVLSSNFAAVHEANVSVPDTALIDQPLRLRIAADFVTVAPTACGTPQFSQTEDYGVVVAANVDPPTADFTTANTTTCDGTVLFENQSLGLPTTYAWDFGDGTTSTEENPQHTYAAPGSYDVQLIAINAFGRDTLLREDYITFNDTVPRAALCRPITVDYCCGYGIYRVQLNTIDNPSANGAAGYEDFSCRRRTRLTEGADYTLSVETSPENAQTTRVWLDLNDDGAFTDDERLASADQAVNPRLTLNVPVGAAVLGVPLRLRISSDVPSLIRELG